MKKKIVFEYNNEPIVTCSKCNAQIFWILTANNKKMPVNWMEDPNERESHFATCPFASQFRRKKK